MRSLSDGNRSLLLDCIAFFFGVSRDHISMEELDVFSLAFLGRGFLLLGLMFPKVESLVIVIKQFFLRGSI
jgi:hypothetical protein